MHAQSLNHVWLFATPWTVNWQAPMSTGFSRQEYCSGLPFPPPGESSQHRDRTGVTYVHRQTLPLVLPKKFRMPWGATPPSKKKGSWRTDIIPENEKISNRKKKNQKSPLKSLFLFLKCPLLLSLIPIIWKIICLLLWYIFTKNSLVFLLGLYWVQHLSEENLHIYDSEFSHSWKCFFLYLFRPSSVIL